MMIYTALFVLCVLQQQVGAFTTTPFSVNYELRNGLSLRQSTSESSELGLDKPVFPVNIPMQRVQGGNTVKTFEIPGWADRVQMEIRTNGRPLRCTAQLWLGPLRNVHTMEINNQDGSKSPYISGLKFKADGQGRVLKISTSPSLEMPVDVAVTVPSVQRSAELSKIFDSVWDNSEKLRVQGAIVGMGEAGSVHTVPIDPDVDAIQVMCWSRDTGKYSLRARIEVLQGPNNKRQEYQLQCGGSTQPFHAVFETPGAGWMVRIVNLKAMEDGLFQAVVIPYKKGKAQTSSGSGPFVVPMKEWWQ